MREAAGHQTAVGDITGSALVDAATSAAGAAAAGLQGGKSVDDNPASSLHSFVGSMRFLFAPGAAAEAAPLPATAASNPRERELPGSLDA